jgi:hypothetical protein
MRNSARALRCRCCWSPVLRGLLPAQQQQAPRAGAETEECPTAIASTTHVTPPVSVSVLAANCSASGRSYACGRCEQCVRDPSGTQTPKLPVVRSNTVARASPTLTRRRGTRPAIVQPYPRLATRARTTRHSSTDCTRTASRACASPCHVRVGRAGCSRLRRQPRSLPPKTTWKCTNN